MKRLIAVLLVACACAEEHEITFEEKWEGNWEGSDYWITTWYCGYRNIDATDPFTISIAKGDAPNEYRVVGDDPHGTMGLSFTTTALLYADSARFLDTSHFTFAVVKITDGEIKLSFLERWQFCDERAGFKEIDRQHEATLTKVK